MSFADLIGTGLVAAVFVQLFQLLRDYFSRRRETHAARRSQAFKLSNELRLMSLRFDAALGKQDYEGRARGEMDIKPIPIPTVDFLAMVDGLTAIDSELLAEIADLQLLSEYADGYLDAGWRLWMDPDDVDAFQVKRAEYFSAKSANLAEKVRHAYSLPAFRGVPSKLFPSQVG